VGEASKYGSVPIVMIEVEFLAWQHRLSAAYAWCAVGAGQLGFAQLLIGVPVPAITLWCFGCGPCHGGKSKPEVEGLG
jgi:hypothetical protein